MKAQCRLRLPDGAEQVAWIDVRGAKVGNQVEIKEDGLFWTVVAVHDVMEDEAIQRNERQYKDHRKGTDI